MVTLEMKDKVQVIEATSEELNATASQQVTVILKESEKTSHTEEPRTAQWHYSVPFAGVRYYSY